MTTINNSMVNLLTGFVYVERGQYGMREAIVQAGLLVGLNMDVSEDFSHWPAKLQFRKFSLIFCPDWKYHLVRNLGLMMRSLG